MIGIIIDVAVILIVALFVLVGIKRGFIKTIKGFISSVLVIVLTIVTLVPVTNMIIVGTEWDNQISAKLETTLADKVPNAYASIYYYDLNEDGEKELIFEIDNQKKDFSRIFEESVLNFVGGAKIIQPVVEEKLDIEDESSQIYLIDALNETLTKYILLAALFTILSILYGIAFFFLSKLLSKLVAELYIMYFFDKTLGAIMGLLIGLAVVLVTITVYQFLAPLEFMSPVTQYVEQTSVIRFIIDNNFLYTFAQNYINLDKLKDIIPSNLLGGEET